MEALEEAIFFGGYRFRAFCRAGEDGEMHVIVTDANRYDPAINVGVIVFDDKIANVPSVGALIGFFAEQSPRDFFTVDYGNYIVNASDMAQVLPNVPVMNFAG